VISGSCTIWITWLGVFPIRIGAIWAIVLALAPLTEKHAVGAAVDMLVPEWIGIFELCYVPECSFSRKYFQCNIMRNFKISPVKRAVPVIWRDDVPGKYRGFIVWRVRQFFSDDLSSIKATQQGRNLPTISESCSYFTANNSIFWRRVDVFNSKFIQNHMRPLGISNSIRRTFGSFSGYPSSFVGAKQHYALEDRDTGQHARKGNQPRRKVCDGVAACLFPKPVIFIFLFGASFGCLIVGCFAIINWKANKKPSRDNN
jgi:hypothetical protein